MLVGGAPRAKGATSIVSALRSLPRWVKRLAIGKHFRCAIASSAARKLSKAIVLTGLEMLLGTVWTVERLVMGTVYNCMINCF